VSGTVDLKSLARRVLQRDTARDSAWDRVSHEGRTASGTAGQHQGLNPASVPAVPSVPDVPTVSPPTMVFRATSIGPDGTGCTVEIMELPQAHRCRKVFGVLQLRPPAMVDVARWRQCVEDGKRFLAKWGSQAEALGWTSADLFGLHTPPEQPHPSYRRLSRYDCTGLVWLLEGRLVVALTADMAAIENPTGAITVFRKNNRPALGPVGDSLDDLE
jgi:hypothetical protein